MELEKNRYTKEEYEKKLNEQWRQMVEDKKEQEKIEKELRKKQNASLKKLKRMVQNKKEVDEFVKKLKERDND